MAPSCQGLRDRCVRDALARKELRAQQSTRQRAPGSTPDTPSSGAPKVQRRALPRFKVPPRCDPPSLLRFLGYEIFL